MNNEIFIETGKRLTLSEYTPIAYRTMSLIAEAATGVDEIDEAFSVADLVILLNKICVHRSGEFEIHRTPSDYCHITYKPYLVNEAEFDEGYRVSDLVDVPDHVQDALWVNEKVAIAFMDGSLYGVAFMLYFYLGYLMTQDPAFGLSHNISFKQILESCAEFSEDWHLKHPTTLMRALADLQDAELIRWNVQGGTFELLYITPYDPISKV